MSRIIMQMIVQMFMRDVLAGFTPASTAVKASNYLHLAAGFLLVLATGFGLWGAHIWFSMNIAADYAMLATAGVMFALAVVAIIAACIFTCVRRARMRAAKRHLQGTVTDIFKLLENSVGQNIQEHPAVSLIIAGLAGYVLAEAVA